MRTVYTKQELQEAFKAHETKIVCKGEAAKLFEKQKKKKRIAAIGGAAAAIACAAAIPFTGGASAIGLGVVASGLTISLTAYELVAILGFSLAAYGIYKKCKVKFSTDEDGKPIVEVEPQYK
jgi:hypothetical protein